MTEIGFIAAGFAAAAILALVGLIAIAANESIHYGRIRAWYRLRKQAKERARARKLPVARLVEGERYEVVSLASTVSRRVR